MEQKVKYARLHVHTEGSLKDAIIKVTDLVNDAVESGAKAVAVTDHGIMTSVIECYTEAKAANIKPIIGVELYISKEGFEKPLHLILYAMDYIGYQTISKIVTESNRNIDSQGRPLTTETLLENYLKKGTIGHGHVIATSACISGVIAAPLAYNSGVNKQMEKLQSQVSKIKFPEGYEEAVSAVHVIEEKQVALQKERAKLKEIANQKFTKAKNQAKKIADEAERANVLAALEAQESEAKKAKSLFEDLKTSVTALAEELKPFKAIVKKGEVSKSKSKELKKRILLLKKDLKSAEVMKSEAVKETLRYKELFGDNFYMELQFHDFESEDVIFPQLAEIAKETGTKVVAANDAHFMRKEDSDTRNMIQNMRYLSTTNPTWMESRPADVELYLKTDAEQKEWLLRILPEDVVMEAMENVGEIVDKCNLEFPEEKHYPEFPNAAKTLRELCMKGAWERFPDGVLPEEYQTRLDYELSVIEKMGYCDYFCIVAEFINYAKSQADNSLEIGPGRGSAAGSLVAYLTGITERIDPVKYNLMFERFLNPERVSMPDIDTDFSSHARNISIEHVMEKYGINSVASILTKMKMGARSSIDYASKLYGLQTADDKTKFSHLAKEIKTCLPDEQSTKLEPFDSLIRTKFASNEDALQIWNRARALEGIPTSYSTHAAGIIIGDKHPLMDTIPLMIAEDTDNNKHWTVQCDMGQAEESLKLLKMDFLGLKNLDIVTNAMRMITRNHGIKIFPNDLPFEEKVIKAIFQTGFTNFVFQFESSGMKAMLREFGPDSFEDLILLVAAYRPGPMQYLPSVVEVKNGRKKMEFLVPELEPILSETYGAVIYQEQVIKICTDLAGYSTAQADNVRRYMSKKKEDKLEHERESFVFGDAERNIPGCVANGIPAGKADALFTELKEFAKYAFNKSHAACYAFVSYITAWFKFYYFKEYICAAIDIQDEKQPQLISDCKEKNVPIYAPDINESEVGYRTYKDGILIGLKAIKGVAAAAEVIVEERVENGLFTSVEAFVERLLPDKRVTESLSKTGVFAVFGTQNRVGLSDYMLQYKDAVKEVLTVEQKLCNTLARDIEELGEKEKKKHKADVLKYKNSLSEKESFLNDIQKSKALPETMTEILAYEKDYMNMWVSGNPMDDYRDFLENGCGKISEASPSGSARYGGVVTNLFIYKQKEMAFFELTGRDGVIPVVCFTKHFLRFKECIKEGAVLIIKGKVAMDGEELKLYVNDIFIPSPEKQVFLFTVKDIVEKADFVLPILRGYEYENGLPFCIYDETFGEFQEGDFLISTEVTERKKLRISTMQKPA